jgi:hypothetical protein
MTISEWGSVAELISSVAVIASLIYLAIEIRHNTAQQKREETVSIQHGQNSVVQNMLDPRIVRAYAITADGDVAVSAQDRATAIVWVIQYINHFQIVCDLYDSGSLEQDRFDLWKGFAVSIVASKGIRAWWEDELGKYAFMPRVRDLIDSELLSSENPPVPFNTMWKIFMNETWKDSSSRPDTPV